MENCKRRWVRYFDEMPYDKVFDVDGRLEDCHATGREVNTVDPLDFTEWWVEYVDSEGRYHYGR